MRRRLEDDATLVCCDGGEALIVDDDDSSAPGLVEVFRLRLRLRLLVLECWRNEEKANARDVGDDLGGGEGGVGEG